MSECKGGKKCPQETISLSTCVYKVSLHFDMSSVFSLLGVLKLAITMLVFLFLARECSVVFE